MHTGPNSLDSLLLSFGRSSQIGTTRVWSMALIGQRKKEKMKGGKRKDRSGNPRFLPLELPAGPGAREAALGAKSALRRVMKAKICPSKLLDTTTPLDAPDDPP